MVGSRAVTATVAVAVILVVAAFGGVYYLRTRTSGVSPPQGAPLTQTAVGACHVEPCSVLASTSIGGTSIELWADAGGRSGRMKFGDVLYESTITGRGAVLAAGSLRCVSGTISACMVRSSLASGEGTVAEVFVGRSGEWEPTDQPYFSDAGYLSLTDVNNDNTPEVVAVQKGYYAQVFQLNGTEMGCTRPVARTTQLPGWPTVKPPIAQLQPC
ncbi:hypothetical protein GCM10029964_112250 [Kibdelosporangium lantanae]